jgi:AcrR family transcriptional regulator
MSEATRSRPRIFAPSQSPWPARRVPARDRDTKREAVIRAAARAFSQHGFHNTSIDDIAKTLNVSKPTIYYYVANKEQLLFECFVAGLELIQAAMDDTGEATSSAGEQLQRLIGNYAVAIASDYGWCMVRAEDQELSPEMSRRIKALKSEIDQGMRRLLRDGMRDGSIRDCDPKMTAFAIAGSLNWIAHWFRSDQSLSPAQVAAAFTRTFFDGLRPATPARGGANALESKKRAATRRRDAVGA